MRKQVPVSGSDGSVGTLARGLDILDLFSRGAPELSQTEMSAALGLPLPTVHRLTAVLAGHGYLRRDPHTKRFRLGLGVARLVPGMLSGLRLPEVARAQVSALAERTGETVNLATLHGGEVIYLMSETGGRLLTSRTPMGMRLPAHCTALGKCLLAQLDDAAAREAAGAAPYAARTPATLTTWPALRAALAAVRATGVAVSEEEFEIGLVSIAVPVVTAGPAGGTALNVSLPTSRATDSFRAEVAGRLRDAAEDIELGACLEAGDGMAALA